jgi:ABC-type oligopeptide transport system substrate-binding subunit
VDDHTFTIELKRPFGPFTWKLGQVAFSPLPDSALKNPFSFERKPVGNGPFRVVRWAPGTETVLERYDGYTGQAKARVGRLAYRMYPDYNKAYADLLGGRLDFMSQVATLAPPHAAEDLDGRVIDPVSGTIQEIGIPRRLGTNADLRKAVSMAIDRKTIAREVFHGKRRRQTRSSRPWPRVRSPAPAARSAATTPPARVPTSPGRRRRVSARPRASRSTTTPRARPRTGWRRSPRASTGSSRAR